MTVTVPGWCGGNRMKWIHFLLPHGFYFFSCFTFFPAVDAFAYTRKYFLTVLPRSAIIPAGEKALI